MANKPEDFKLTVQEEYVSTYNGRLLIVDNPLLGLNVITVDKTVVSGQVMEHIWEKALAQIKNELTKNGKPFPNSALILGLGAGNNVRQLKKYWPKIITTGIEIDPVLLSIGNKYFDLNKNAVEIILTDVTQFKTHKKFDLILVDLFVGSLVPRKFEEPSFLNKIEKWLSPEGSVIFNRIVSSNHKGQTLTFKKTLIKRFPKVLEMPFFHNLLLFCQK
jgi:spermidine synthase